MPRIHGSRPHTLVTAGLGFLVGLIVGMPSGALLAYDPDDHPAPPPPGVHDIHDLGDGGVPVGAAGLGLDALGLLDDGIVHMVFV